MCDLPMPDAPQMSVTVQEGAGTGLPIRRIFADHPQADPGRRCCPLLPLPQCVWSRSRARDGGSCRRRQCACGRSDSTVRRAAVRETGGATMRWSHCSDAFIVAGQSDSCGKPARHLMSPVIINKRYFLICRDNVSSGGRLRSAVCDIRVAELSARGRADSARLGAQDVSPGEVSAKGGGASF